MGYQALYRRYRPARFEDFVGQEAVIKTLRSQITSGRIAHAYLFCGPRGTAPSSTSPRLTLPATTAWTRSAICAKR